jgi:chemotaxis protein methyltransferase CheR
MKELILNDLKNLDAERHIKIHSAACSSGQEPLSIAMLIQEHIDKKNLRLNYHIDAVDISLPCIEKCKKGFYSQYEIQRGLPIKLLNKYFKQYHETFWKFKCQYQKFIDYKQGNILTSKMDADSRHVIFCRNVTIYMNKVNVRKIYEKFHKALKKGGWLIIGHSESMHLHKDLFEMVKFHGAIAYQKRG